MRKDGSLIPIELCVSRADIPGGGAPLFVGIIRDMSAFAAAERSRDEERVRSQQQLAEQTAALQQANVRLRMADRMASIGTLAAGLGHDMNNVLLPVRARLNALRASGEAGHLPRTDRKHVDEIQRSVAYLQQLADGLHFLALDPETEEDQRGGGGATDLKQWWSQAGPLLSKAVPKHVRVTCVFPPDLPLAAVAAHGLTQAILNLVVNAGEAVPPPSERKRKQGSVRISAGLKAATEGRWIALSVIDNGTGMSEDVKRRAFEMFFTTKPRGLGTGLGLALVRKVVERAGGRVEIESEVGKGTTVTMVVPAVRAASERIGAEKHSAVVSVGDGRVAGLIAHLLESSGASAQRGDDPATASIWVVDPAASRLDAARAWRRGKPEGRLVLFGRPDPAMVQSWRSLNPLIIDAPDDFEAVRAALNRALSST
jgi:signal transduction histidine kinase